MVKNLVHIVLISIFFWSCGNQEGNVSESKIKDLGRIKFDIHYPNPPEDPFIRSTIPDSIIYFFKDDFVRTEVNLAKGNIQLNYIANSATPSLKESMKVYFDKSQYSYNHTDIKEYLSQYPSYEITETGKTKSIAGYHSKECLVKDQNGNTFNIYYTEELKANNPNWFTPFPQIKGIVLEYQMVQYNFLMNVSASKVEMIESDSLSFEFSNDFSPITKEELNRNHSTFEQFGQ